MLIFQLLIIIFTIFLLFQSILNVINRLNLIFRVCVKHSDLMFTSVDLYGLNTYQEKIKKYTSIISQNQLKNTTKFQSLGAMIIHIIQHSHHQGMHHHRLISPLPSPYSLSDNICRPQSLGTNMVYNLTSSRFIFEENADC